MTQRDPRVDPRPGDVLWDQGGYRREVERVNRHIEYIIGRFGYRVTRSQWRRMNANATVVRRAEEATR